MKLGPLADELLEKASGRTPAPRLASFLEKGLRAAAYSTPVCDDGIRCARDGARRRIRFTSHCNP